MFFINDNLNTAKRYDMAKFLNCPTDSLTMLDSYFVKKLTELSYSGTITVTSQVHKPDLLSYDIYGETTYWWILMLYNGLKSPLELEAGLNIRFPSLSSLENIYFTLSTQQKIKDEQ